jgi:dissimilatory sulfite reductase (desulfoviridin) alpha/beta subunit
MKNNAEVKIGNWYTMCCQRDLCEIVDQEDIDLILNLLEDNSGVWTYNTKLEALYDIRESYVNGKLNVLYDGEIEVLNDEIENCDKMIMEELIRKY